MNEYSYLDSEGAIAAIETQRRIVRFLLESDLLPRTNDDRLLDLAFEFDSPVSPCDDVHLSDFVNLIQATFEGWGRRAWNRKRACSSLQVRFAVFR